MGVVLRGVTEEDAEFAVGGGHEGASHIIPEWGPFLGKFRLRVDSIRSMGFVYFFPKEVGNQR